MNEITENESRKNESRIPMVEFFLEGQGDGQSIRSFIDNTDHIQFRCECDEWLRTKVGLDLIGGVIFFELECPLCGKKEHRKMYVDIDIGTSLIENFIDKYDLDDKEELLYELGSLKLDIDIKMEDVAKDAGLTVPSEDEIIEIHRALLAKYFGTTKRYMENKKRKEENGFDQYISAKYGKKGRIQLSDGMSEYDILLGIKGYDMDEDDKKFLNEDELSSLEELNEIDDELI